MKTTVLLSRAFVLSSLVAAPFASACSSSTSKDASNAEATGSPSATGAPATTAGATSQPTAQATSAAATPSATAQASSAPSGGPAEVAKDPEPLVVDVKVEASSGTLAQADADKVKATFVALAAASPKVAMVGTKGATGKRRIAARLILDPVVEGKDKYSVKVTIDAVTLDGHCPLFHLKKAAELERAIKNANEQQKADFEKRAKIEDTEAVRNAAVQLIFAELEAQQAKLKPDAQCLPDKH